MRLYRLPRPKVANIVLYVLLILFAVLTLFPYKANGETNGFDLASTTNQSTGSDYDVSRKPYLTIGTAYGDSTEQITGSSITADSSLEQAYSIREAKLDGQVSESVSLKITFEQPASNINFQSGICSMQDLNIKSTGAACSVNDDYTRIDCGSGLTYASISYTCNFTAPVNGNTISIEHEVSSGWPMDREVTVRYPDWLDYVDSTVVPDLARDNRVKWVFYDVTTINLVSDFRILGEKPTPTSTPTRTPTPIHAPTQTPTATWSPPVCYRLDVSHTGKGSDPVTTPPNTYGCETGYFAENDFVFLSATPDEGYGVSSWEGTELDNSEEKFNTVKMPGRDHALSVEYVPIVDLAVSSIKLEDRNIPFLPWLIDIQVAIENNGAAGVERATLNLYVDSVSPANRIATKEIDDTIFSGNLNPWVSSWISYKVPSQKWENHKIIAEVTTLEERKPEDNTKEQLVSIYYADFRMDQDAFSFANPEWDWDVFISFYKQQMKQMLNPTQWWRTGPVGLLGLLIESEGHCYGMASASITYWNFPSTIPNHKEYTYLLSDNESLDDIREHYWSQVPLIRDHAVFGWEDPNQAYTEAKAAISNGQPVIVSWKHKKLSDKDKEYGHAVVGYKIIEYLEDGGSSQSAELVVYDNNQPLRRYEDEAWMGTNDRQEIILFDQQSTGVGRIDCWGYDCDYIDVSSPNVFPFASNASTDTRSTSTDQEIALAVYQLYQHVLSDLRQNDEIMVVVGSDNADGVIVDNTDRRIGNNLGSLISEIPKARYRVAETGWVEVYYVPADGEYTVKVQGTSVGKADLYFVSPQNDRTFDVYSFEGVPVTAESVTTVHFSRETDTKQLHNDANGDGAQDTTLSPTYVGKTTGRELDTYLPFVSSLDQ